MMAKGNLMKQAWKLRNTWHRDGLYNNLLRSGRSWQINQTLKEQNIDWPSFEVYQFWNMVHSLLRIYVLSDQKAKLVRVGGDGDGGYLMACPLSKKKIAYSFGIGNDVSWDLDMAKRGYEVYQYDHTIDKLPLNHKRFHWFKMGITGETESKTLKLLETFIQMNKHQDCEGMVLKMDVEGYERDVLANIPQNVLCQFDQIVIELHGLHKKDSQKVMKKALENLTGHFKVIHIHGHNGGPVMYCGELVTPNTMEVTLVNENKYSLESGEGVVLPRMLDYPIDPALPEVWLGRWNPAE